jgi:hypothetical protein
MKRNVELIFQRAILERVRKVTRTLSLCSVNSFWRKRRLETNTGSASNTFYISSLGRRRADDVKPQKSVGSGGKSEGGDKERHKVQ